MTKTVSLDDLKKALRLEGVDSIAEWVRTLTNPQGNRVDRTNVYKAIQSGSPQWLVDEIHSVIQRSRDKHPNFWE